MVSETLISFDLTRLMAEEDFIDERVLFKIWNWFQYEHNFRVIIWKRAQVTHACGATDLSISRVTTDTTRRCRAPERLPARPVHSLNSMPNVTGQAAFRFSSTCVLSKGFGGQAVGARCYAASTLQVRVRISFMVDCLTAPFQFLMSYNFKLDWKMLNCFGFEKRRPWPIWRRFFVIRLEKMRKTTGKFQSG
jgi:hypothetical protein